VASILSLARAVDDFALVGAVPRAQLVVLNFFEELKRLVPVP
jgi:hypothetical protein